MSEVRYFVFLYPEDRRLQELLDLAIYILNPQEKWPAHVTVAGPYEDKRKLPRKRRVHSKVSALGVGAFRSPSQNTVFLRVGASEITELWDKPDFGGSRIPHITLYDGDNSALADALLDRLKHLRLFFYFYVDFIHIVGAVRGQYRSDLISRVNPAALLASTKLTLDDIQSLSLDERIDLSCDALRKAKYYLSLDSAKLL